MKKLNIPNNQIFLSPPHMGQHEREFVAQAFDSNFIAPLGPMVDAFEKEFSEYVGIEHCVALSSGTAAMHLALRHLGINPKDEVFASTLTFIGSVSPISFLGAYPVFIDACRSTWKMDPNLLDNELKSCAAKGKLPKAVIPTDLYGQCSDYDERLVFIDDYDSYGTELNDPRPISRYSLMRSIYRNGPHSAYIYMGSGCDFDNDGVYRCDSQNQVNHAVVLVGFDVPDRYWIAKNSWGTSWPEEDDDGYFKVGFGEAHIDSALINKVEI